MMVFNRFPRSFGTSPAGYDAAVWGKYLLSAPGKRGILLLGLCPNRPYVAPLFVPACLAPRLGLATEKSKHA
jgi:hypothetical protein